MKKSLGVLIVPALLILLFVLLNSFYTVREGQQAMDHGDALDFIALFDTINPAAAINVVCNIAGPHCPMVFWTGSVTLLRFPPKSRKRIRK